MTKKTLTGAAFILCAALLLAAVFLILLQKTSPSSEPSPNIVLIIMDTTRQDHCSCYDYARKTTPTLENLARSSTVYRKAYTPAGWTSPAHASLFTGLYPIGHRASQENWVLGEEWTTIAEVLSTHGFETIGIVENPVLAVHNNFDQGFQHYYETWKAEEGDADMNKALYAFQAFLSSRNEQKPFFAFINFIEPHAPYNSSGPFYETFISDFSIQLEHNMWTQHFLGKVKFSEKQIQHLLELYDAEILYTDYLVGQIIKSLGEHDLWEETVFIVTSDHGENIGDHDMMAHVFSLHESIIKIPLIIHYPKLFPPGTKDQDPALLVDIFPTLLHLCGIDEENFPSHGQNLLESNRNGRKIFAEYYYPKQALSCFPKEQQGHVGLERFKRRIKAVIDGRFKLIWGSNGAHELYDLEKDPGEEVNLIQDEHFKKQKQKQEKALGKFVKNHFIKRLAPPEDSLKKMDSKTLEALRALGYIK
ncbi:MAG: sulfatase [Deltaproteobacteria bacterium]|nr:sulfatase [Deltaproteobacteria bacterium]